MNFGPQRGHITCIFDSFFKDYGLALIAGVVSLIRGDMDLLFENVGLMIIVLMGPVLRVFGYLTTTYALDEEKLIIRSGIFTKNVLEIPLSTITTVDLSQNLFHRVFDVYRLNIDNNANLSDGETKVHMTLKKSDADTVRSLLIKGRQGLDGSNFAGEKGLAECSTGNERHRYVVKRTDLLLMGLLKSKTVFLLELLGGITVFSNLLAIDWEEETVDGIFDVVNRIGVSPTILLVLASLFVVGSLCGMMGSFLKYYGFKVLDNGEAVKIEYGLLNHKTYTISKKKTIGFYYEQSALMRLLDVGILYLIAVGYGTGSDEETSEEALLFPLIKKGDIRQIIGSIIPEMMEYEPYEKPERTAMRYFFMGFSVVFASFCLLGSFYLPKIDDFFHNAWILGAVFLASRLLQAYLAYRTTGIYGNASHFSLCYGGYKKMTVFVKTSMIESIVSKGSIWKRKRGYGNITIDCFASLRDSSQSVSNLSLDTFDRLKHYLIY